MILLLMRLPRRNVEVFFTRRISKTAPSLSGWGKQTAHLSQPRNNLRSIRTGTYFAKCDGNAGQTDAPHRVRIVAIEAKTHAAITELAPTRPGNRSLRSSSPTTTVWAAQSQAPQKQPPRYSIALCPHQLTEYQGKRPARHRAFENASTQPHVYTGSHQCPTRF